MTLEDTMATATKTVTDTAATATGKAKDYGTTAVTTVTDTAATASGKAKDHGTAAVTSITDSTSAATEKATEFGTAAASALSGAVESFVASSKELMDQLSVSIKEFQFGEKKVGERAEATVDSVKDYQIGDKKVGERATAAVHSMSDRVETVSDRLDVDQIQDQVAKLRHQMEGVVGTWKESFRPSDAAGTPTRKAPARTKAASKPAKKDDLTEIKGIGPVTADKLNADGITTFAALASASSAEVSDVAGTSKSAASKWIKGAKARS